MRRLDPNLGLRIFDKFWTEIFVVMGEAKDDIAVIGKSRPTLLFV